jgi:hypothetical protein
LSGTVPKGGDTRMSELRHGMNCRGLIPGEETACTCGLVHRKIIEQLRIELETEQTMHAAWRKRAEEAEEKLARGDGKEK